MVNYSKSYEVRWADLDPNWHLRHSAYADYCTQTRFAFLAENGFPASRFAELGFGPVIFRESTRYLREVRMNDTIRVDFRVTEMNDAGHWKIIQQVFRGETLAAVHEIEGAWLDLAQRKLRQAPPDLVELLSRLMGDTAKA